LNGVVLLYWLWEGQDVSFATTGLYIAEKGQESSSLCKILHIVTEYYRFAAARLGFAQWFGENAGAFWPHPQPDVQLQGEEKALSRCLSVLV